MPIFILLMLCVGKGHAENTLAITKVSASRVYDMDNSSNFSIGFHTNKPALINLAIYDEDDVLVRELKSNGMLNSGEHSFNWDGISLSGRRVTSGHYVYTVSATDEKGYKVIHDLTDITGGNQVVAENLHYDSESGLLNYSLSHTARLFLRAGLENGFVVKTLINNELVAAGHHTITWNGWDDNQVISLKENPKLRFYGRGFKVSKNSFFVKNNAGSDTKVERQSDIFRSPLKKPKGLDRHFYHSPKDCRDVKIVFSLPEALPKSKDGLPVVSGAVPLRVTLSLADSIRMESERAEISFFINDQLLYENEISYFPYTWNWEPKVLPGGVHYLTAFIAGFGEHYGSSTVKFELSK